MVAAGAVPLVLAIAGPGSANAAPAAAAGVAVGVVNAPPRVVGD
ncbi:hypothetical protein ACIRRA_22105 [Nocardia sp. NPDC101769]